MSDENTTPTDAPASEPPPAPAPVMEEFVPDAPPPTAEAEPTLSETTEHVPLAAYGLTEPVVEGDVPPEVEAELPAEAAEAPAETVSEEGTEEPTLEAEAEPAPTEAAAESVAPAPAKPRRKKAAPAASEPESTAEPAASAATPAEPAADSPKKWYVVKIQSGREETIKAAIERKVKIEGLEEFYGQIAIPTEEFVEKKKVSVKDKKTGQKVTQEKNVVKHRKKFPGYLFANVEFNDRILYLFRETSGVGDFVGAAGPMKPPPPMNDREVQTMLTGIAGPDDKKKKAVVKLDFEKGDKVRVKDGAFAGSEAEVKAITMPKDPTDTPKVTVVVTIWGRPVEMEMDYWHVDKV